MGKKLETKLPRRTYFYLTTYSQQSIPDASALNFQSRAIISPSKPGAVSRIDETDAERRREVSPSPEVDLSSPDIENDDIAIPLRLDGVSSGLPAALPRNHRTTLPPLEKDETEFVQTAREIQKRNINVDVQMGAESLFGSI